MERFSGKSNVELSCEMATKLAEAFQAQLPVGSKVVVGRDYNKSSRMIKELLWVVDFCLLVLMF